MLSQGSGARMWGTELGGMGWGMGMNCSGAEIWGQIAMGLDCGAQSWEEWGWGMGMNCSGAGMWG